MKGDFSRGHQPDAARGRRYRRVLAQQGRVVLDSDLNAGAEAGERNLRDLAADVLGEGGARRGGFVVTPGRLFADFDVIEHVRPPIPPGADFRFTRDFRHRTFGRLPTLHLDATRDPGSVTVRGRARVTATPSNPSRRLTMQGDVPLSGFHVSVGGMPATIALVEAATPFSLYAIDPPPGMEDYDEVTFELELGVEARIARIDVFETTTSQRCFWVTRGRYLVDGLSVELPEDTRLPPLAFPMELVPDGSSYVAWLDARERLVTSADDPGLRDAALGGADTTLRTVAEGLVKLARVTGSSADIDASIQRAFHGPPPRPARLRVATAPTVPADDPCALPLPGGYVGAEHRLYRFEVFDAGTTGELGDVTLLWSRDNAGTVTEVAVPLTGETIRVFRDVGLRDGDLVELRIAGDDVWDADIAEVDVGAASLRLPRPRAGELFVLRGTDDPQVFAVHHPTTLEPAAVTPGRRGGGVRVRRWDGVLRTQPESVGDPPVAHFDLGDGVVIDLEQGPEERYRTGDAWQYEAREGGGEGWSPSAAPPLDRGPRAVPLARLEFFADGEPLRLRARYDRRHPRLERLEADDIAYDGAAIGAPSLSVQEALDALFLQDGSGCCQTELGPEPSGDDADRIAVRISEGLPDGGVLCLRAGVYRIESTVLISGRRVEIRGCPDAVLLCTSSGESFSVSANAELVLRNLTIKRTGSLAPVVVLKTMDAPTDAPPTLRVFDSTVVHLAPEGDDGACAIAAQEIEVPAVDLNAATLPEVGASGALRKVIVELDGSVVLAPVAVLVNELASLRVTRSRILPRYLGLCARYVAAGELVDSVVMGAYPDALRSDLDAQPGARARELVDAWCRSPSVMGYPCVALAAPDAQKLDVRGTLLRTLAGVWVDRLYDATFAHNRYRCMDALRADTMERVSFDRERVEATRHGVHVVHSVSRVSLRASEVTARTCVLIGATVERGLVTTAPDPSLTDLQVSDNTFAFTTREAGRINSMLQLGPTPATDSYAGVLPTVGAPASGAPLITGLSYDAAGLPPNRLGRLERVVIRGNRFLPGPSDASPDVCVSGMLFDLLDSPFVPSSPGVQGDGIHVGLIEGNEVRTGMVGILVRGSGWSVRNNTINRRAYVLPGPATAFRMYAGVVVWDSVRAMPIGPGADPLNTLCMLTSVTGNTIDIGLSYVTGEPNVHAVAVAVRTGGLNPSFVNVQGNLINCPHALISLDLAVLTVSANTTGTGSIFIRKCAAGTMRDNRLGGLGVVELDKCSAMAVVDNDLPSLSFTRAAGFFQVLNNRTVLDITLLPALADAEDGDAGPSPYSISNSIYSGFALSLAAESVVVAQVSGNWCHNLTLGNPLEVAYPSPLSAFQVTGNMSTGGIGIRAYQKLVFTSNVSNNFAVPEADTSVLLNSNLDYSP